MLYGLALPADTCKLDSASLYYKAGVSSIRIDFRENKSEITRFITSVRKERNNRRPVRIVIRSSASPEGTDASNRRLANDRADSLARYIVSRTDIPLSAIEKYPEDVTWNRLREMVAESDMYNRGEVLATLDSIITETAENQCWEYANDSLWFRLRSLDSGKTYRYMFSHMFPDLRTSTVALYGDTLHEPMPTPRGTDLPVRLDRLPLPPASVMPTQPVSPVASPGHDGSRLFIKTNAVALGLLILNAAVEWQMSDLLSVNIPVYYSAADYFSNNRKFRILGTQPELRFWPLKGKGLFAGIHFGVASYNFALSGNDWRIQDHNGHTPALGGGISLGYRTTFCRNKRFHLEFSIGAGAYRAHYDKFHNDAAGTFHSTVDKTFIGIDNVAVSFSYMFNLK